MRRCVTALLVLSVSASRLLSQELEAGGDTPKGSEEAFGVWGGISFSSPGGILLGKVTGREFLITGLRYQRRLARRGILALSYTLDFIPVAVVTKNPRGPGVRTTMRGENPSFLGPPGGAVYGLGFAPLGVEISVFDNKPFSLLLAGSGGLLAFAREVPFGNARKINVTFDITAALRAPAWSSVSPVIGYKFHHLSNAGTGDFNPGLDANLWFVGVVLRR